MLPVTERESIINNIVYITPRGGGVIFASYTSYKITQNAKTLSCNGGC